MPAISLLFALLIVAAFVGTIGLWYAIDSETDDQPRMDRADAERAVRQDSFGHAGDDDAHDGERNDGTDDGSWGNESDWGVDDHRG